MTDQNHISLFEGKQVRYLWDEEKQQYFFSVVDVIQVLTDSSNPQTYWRVLKKRLSDEGNETVTNCNALKLPAPDGKMRLTDVAYFRQACSAIHHSARRTTAGHWGRITLQPNLSNSTNYSNSPN